MRAKDFTLLQVAPALESGGVETLTVALARSLARAGGRSLVASRGGRLEGELADAGARHVRLPAHSRNPLVMAANVGRLERLIRAEQVSLVHVRSRASAFSALAAARRVRVPLVTTYHGIYAAGSPWKRWYNGVMTRGDVVIANSGFTRDHLLAQHPVDPARVVVIPEGVDTEVFDPARVAPARVARLRAAWGLPESDAHRVVLVAARLTGWKGHAVVIEAAARIADPAGILLVFAGEGERTAFAASLMTSARAAGLGAQVRIVGPCDDMPAAFALADLVAAPSTLAESFGRTVAEAGAMQRVVLASRLGGPAETVVPGQTGWLATPGDVDAWTAALERGLSMSAEARDRMGRAARARVSRLYSLDAMCEATFELYRRLVERRG